MARKTKLEAEQTRARILDAAERLFFERGVGNTSLEEIAAAADVTRGAVYWHFRNKADLFHALHESISLPQERLMERAVAERHPDPLAVVEEAAINAFSHIADDPRSLRVFSILMFRCEYVDDMENALDRQREVNKRLDCKLVEAFELARAHGQLDERWTPATAALAFRTLLSGLLADFLRDPRDRCLAREARTALRPLFQSFRAPAATAKQTVPAEDAAL